MTTWRAQPTTGEDGLDGYHVVSDEGVVYKGSFTTNMEHAYQMQVEANTEELVKTGAPPSELETFKAMLSRAGVRFTQGESVDAPPEHRRGENRIVIATKDSPKNAGYYGFYAIFEFTPGGALDHVEIWE